MNSRDTDEAGQMFQGIQHLINTNRAKRELRQREVRADRTARYSLSIGFALTMGAAIALEVNDLPPAPICWSLAGVLGSCRIGYEGIRELKAGYDPLLSNKNQIASR